MRTEFLAVFATFLVTLSVASTEALARPQEPAAPEVGSEACRDCHADLFSRFQYDIHAGTTAGERMSGRSGCEACHGSGTLHLEDPSNTTGLITFAPGRESESIAACLRCHASDRAVGAFGRSEHGRQRIACHECHESPHAENSEPMQRTVRSGLESVRELGSHVRQERAELCLKCHGELRGRFSMPYRHPVREKAVACTSCHKPHQPQPIDARARNAICFSCHEEKRGPWPFEHAPVAEDCMSCHEAHGSVAPALVRTSQPFLCLTCHSLPDDRHGAEIGGTRFSQAIYGRCTSCHGAIHGSHEDRHLKK